ncbi:MAG TPA: DAHL domain-containing protein [Casimicrobiaceae bacterium]
MLRWMLGALAATALIGVLAVLYAKSSKVDAEKKIQVEGYVEQLKQLDAEWNVDVLKSRMELNRNYDPLVSPLPRLVELSEELGREAAAVRQADTQRAMSELTAAIDEKIDLVDQFKAQNAILKNSLRYAPTAVEELRAQIRSAQRASPRQSEALAALDGRASQALNDLFKYNLFPDAGTARAIEKTLVELEFADDAYPAAIEGSVHNFANHARIVLAQRSVENNVLAHILLMPMAQTIDRVGAVFERDFEAAIDETNRYRNYLLAYSSLLLALLGYIGSRLFRSYRIIANVNKELTHANETLEQRVQDRTEELSKALDHLKESETQLVHSEKMASLGQMVAGVAHEINTPLAYVRSSLETVEAHFSGFLREFIGEMVKLVTLMRAADATEAEVAEQFEAAVRLTETYNEYAIVDEIQGLLKDGVYGVDQIGGIVVNLKNFSRLDRSHMARCTVEECIDNTLLLAKSVVAGKRVRKIYGSTEAIRCAPSQINQVLLNLITNAAQATSDDRGIITVVSRMQDAGHVAVDVTDNGVGIAADVLPKIFDPFFTTKQVGQGTGLGLSIAYKIVEQHGGCIKVHSKAGVGTKFTVVFPIEGAANATSIDPRAAAPDSIAA